MLSRDEEHRLVSFLGVLRHNVAKGVEVDPVIEMKSYLWLAEKLEEVNNELKKESQLCLRCGTPKLQCIHD